MENTTKFSDLGISEEILRAVEEMGYTQPSPIQLQAIPFVLQGRDLIGQAQTGTGKTAAFAIPIIDLVDAEFNNYPMPYPRTSGSGRGRISKTG